MENWADGQEETAAEVTQRSWSIVQRNQKIQTVSSEINAMQTYSSDEEDSPDWEVRTENMVTVGQAVVTVEIEHRIAGPTSEAKWLITRTPIYLSISFLPSSDGIGDIGWFSLGNDVDELSQDDPSGLTKKIMFTAWPMTEIAFKCIDVTYTWEESLAGGEFKDEGSIYFYSNGTVTGDGTVGKRIAELAQLLIGSFNSRLPVVSAAEKENQWEATKGPKVTPLPANLEQISPGDKEGLKQGQLAPRMAQQKKPRPELRYARRDMKWKEILTWAERRTLDTRVDLEILLGSSSYKDQLTIRELLDKLIEHQAPFSRIRNLLHALGAALKEENSVEALPPLILVPLNAQTLDTSNKTILDDLGKGQPFRYIQALSCVRILQGDDARSLLSAFLRWMHEAKDKGDGDDLGNGIRIQPGSVELTEPVKGLQEEFFEAMRRIGYFSVTSTTRSA